MSEPEAEVDWVDQARRATAFIAWLYRLQQRARREREALGSGSANEQEAENEKREPMTSPR